MSKNLVAIVRYAKPLEIEADPGLFENFEALPGFYMGRYQDKPEFDGGLFKVK